MEALSPNHLLLRKIDEETLEKLVQFLKSNSDILHPVGKTIRNHKATQNSIRDCPYPLVSGEEKVLLSCLEIQIGERTVDNAVLTDYNLYLIEVKRRRSSGNFSERLWGPYRFIIDNFRIVPLCFSARYGPGSRYTVNKLDMS